MKTQQGLPDWLPDWRKKEQYPDPVSTTLKQWAWEFLRRNVQYQNDFASGLVENCEEKYGIINMLSPSLNFLEAEKERLLFSDFFLPHCLNSEDYEAGHSLAPRSQTEVVMVFDLSLPLKLQLDGAKERLEMERYVIAGSGTLSESETSACLDPDRIRKWKKQYRLYLRILDAELSGETPAAKITRKILLSSEVKNYREDLDYDTKRIKNSHTAAKAFRDRNYRFLAIYQQGLNG